ncbi:MAG TPA: phosphodiester glycosidase family protein [Gemmatimonadaceae bacterium]|nr:phosphodiester glycosidase family protein [Gemmatimonadaceae bacterium]
MDTSPQMVERRRRGSATARETNANAARRYDEKVALVNAGRATVMIGRAAVIAMFLALLPPATSRAQGSPPDSAPRSVAPGVTLRTIVRPEGPWVIHALAVALSRGDLEVHAARACDRFTGRERPSAISKRLNAEGAGVVAAINAGFFDLEGGSGVSENNVVVDGEIVKGVATTESPFGRRNTVRSQFAIEADGRPAIERFRLAGTVRTPRGRWPLGSLNGDPVVDGVALYTSWTTRPPRFPATVRSVSIPLERVGGHGDTLRYRVRADGRDSVADSTIAHGLLVGTGRAAAGIGALRPGDVITVVATITPGGTPRALVGGWPAIVHRGESIAARADSVEGTFPRFSSARHPRSAVGISRGGDTLLLVAVDGRQASSVGMSLVELAQTMIELGAWDAVNLDGGGSTALVVNDSVVSSPSDPTGERAVGDVLLVTRAAGERVTRRLPARNIVPSCVLAGARDPDR